VWYRRILLNRRSKIDARVLASELLLEIVARGKDATGASWVDPSDGEVYYYKRAGSAWGFVKELKSLMSPDVRICILHTRYATQGSPSIDANNHPIIRPRIIGVHNGHISNDDALFNEVGVKRIGQVDSEAAFALIESVGSDADSICEALPRLIGGAALAWIDLESPETLRLARVKSSPLAIAQSKTGQFVFCSQMNMLNRAAAKSNLALTWRAEVGEGTYLKVEQGAINDWSEFAASGAGYALPSYSAPSLFADIDDDDAIWAEYLNSEREGDWQGWRG